MKYRQRLKGDIGVEQTYCTRPGADPGFPVGGGADTLGGTNIRFCQIFRKTA